MKKHEDLIRMANQIAAFHGAYPEEEAVEGVAQHIRDFWDPRMRRALSEVLASDAKAGLCSIAEKAAARLEPEKTA